jgi:4-carboxymuconolactone decarboxylase
MSKPDGEKLLDELTRKRGYVLDMHRVLAKEDPAFLQAYENFLAHAYLGNKSLDRRTKELIYVGVLTALSSPKHHIVAHIKAGLAAGSTPAEMLEVLQQTLPPAGVPRFIEGIDAWREACPGEDGSRPGDTENEGNPE